MDGNDESDRFRLRYRLGELSDIGNFPYWDRAEMQRSIENQSGDSVCCRPKRTSRVITRAALRDGAMLFFGQMSERAEDGLRKFAQICLLLAAGACLVFWLLRVWHAISFVTPYMIVTTGGEEVALFPIWKLVQHQAVYADPHLIPFAYSNYNWAFYFFYGWTTRAFLHLFGLDAIWIPTIGRLISLVFTVVTGGVMYLSLRAFLKAGFFASRQAAWAWILIVTLCPLVGFWSITVRPDIGALAFEAAGFYLVLRHLREPKLRLIVAAAILFYMAWAFKQTSVTMLTGSALALAFSRRWRAFLTLSGIW
jgi:Dolichyl-phosphate-mannose-protein mannosyltransferase